MHDATQATESVASWGRIDVERLGGIAGYGLPGAHIRSRGHVMSTELNPADQATLLALFHHTGDVSRWLRDGFRYHLTRQSDCGPQTTIAAESSVPQAIRDCVHDEIIAPDSD